MTLIHSNSEATGGSLRERTVLSVVLCTVGVLTALDVYEDWHDGSPISHIVPEVFVIVSTVGIALYLLRHAFRTREDIICSARMELVQAREKAAEWKEQADVLRKGLTLAISGQFDQWGLSPAEQDVGFLLLKGLSIQEISQIRETTERTVRQQASEIYKKSGLSGRAQLSAFFLEDLFDRDPG